ncbi:MAG: hypothetical protein JSR76_01980, partial [Verrucomicrobia bacterium]|nr:hypothetical protein [Verrucomicrobiota bacterium]
MVLSSPSLSFLCVYSCGASDFALLETAKTTLKLPSIPDGVASVEERIEACVTATFSDILLQRDRVTFLEKRAIVVYNCQKKQ